MQTSAAPGAALRIEMLRLYARAVLHRGTLKAEAAGLTTLDAPVARAEHRDATGSLDVVIVSYRCRDHLSRCLASVERYAPARTSVWVVDNDSRDGTVEMVRDRFPSVSLIESTENAGFARATNRGITAGSAPYVLALNPDTELHEDTLSGLLRLMEEHPEIGIAGPRLERPDGTFDHASRRSFPTLLGALGHFSGIGRRLERGPLAQYRAPEVERGPVDAVNGAFMLIRRAALEQVGLLRRGLLDVHGGSRPLLSVQGGGMADVVRAELGCSSCERRIRRTPIPAARACVPRWDVAVL